MLYVGAVSTAAQTRTDGLLVTSDSASESEAPPSAKALSPSIKSFRDTDERQGVDWESLVVQSVAFMSLENAFRCATEKGTRAGFSDAFLPGYLNSVGNLHGWNDGDPFYVNYVGHPMQGAVSGYLWTHNDLAYRNIQFGQNRRYWKGKLRGAAYSYVYSVLFEIGPISEASIGHIQAQYPQQGFVDHVVTPVIGLGWSITEDALDQYLIRSLEARTSNSWVRLLVRGGLNPARSMANVLAFRPPWHRDNRPGVASNLLQDLQFMDSLHEYGTARVEAAPPPGIAPFEFNVTAKVQTNLGDRHRKPCVGGGGSGALRFAPQWYFVVDVSGCKLLGLQENYSGDSLTYLAGVRWTPQRSHRWTPHVELMIGGRKMTEELTYPDVKRALFAGAKKAGLHDPPHSAYTENWESNGFTFQAGSGLDIKLNSALSFRLAKISYSHSWSDELNGVQYRDSLNFVSGLVLRMGTW